VNHFPTPEFWDCYRKLPLPLQHLADAKFLLLKHNPSHPSLRLKRVGDRWSVRVGLGCRVLGVERPDGMVWFWIGNHKEYERLIAGN
jgi:hypothetical protein